MLYQGLLKDGDGNVITWDVETFNMVWVYDTSDRNAKLETDPTDGDPTNGVPNQYYVKVGCTYTSDNTYPDIHHLDWWPIYYETSKETALPWADYEKGETGYEAWNWKETVQTTQSATRTEEYYTASMVNFAVGAGDSDGRVAP